MIPNLDERLCTVRVIRAWSKIPYATKHQEALEMVNNANAQTKSYYELGRYYEHNREENWVGLWYLRRSFENAPRQWKCGQKVDVLKS
jgi:hypothetical protein